MLKEGQEKQLTQEEIEKTRESVDAFGSDFVHEIASAENDIRSGVKSKEDTADAHSTALLRLKEVENKLSEAEKKARKDNLTGLLNRNAYLADVPGQLNVESRYKRHCSMLVVDFDHFKSVNDRYGHNVGDQALRELARMLEKFVRSSDKVYRWGGEEFVIMLPETGSSDAADLAERIRERIEASPIVIENKKNSEDGKEVIPIPPITITVSIGCAGTDQLLSWKGYHRKYSEKKAMGQGEEEVFGEQYLKEEFFKPADDALRRAKEDGRNRVKIFGEDLPEE